MKKKTPKPPGPPAPAGSEPDAERPWPEFLSREELDRLSTLQIVDVICSKLPPRHTSLLGQYIRELIHESEHG